MTNAQIHSEIKKATHNKNWYELNELITEKVKRTVDIIMKDIEK